MLQHIQREYVSPVTVHLVHAYPVQPAGENNCMYLT